MTSNSHPRAPDLGDRVDIHVEKLHEQQRWSLKSDAVSVEDAADEPPLVTDGGQYADVIDLGNVPVDELSSAFQGAQTVLLQRGSFVNSVRIDDDGRLTHLHVVRKRSADATGAHGLRKREEYQSDV